MIPLYTKYRPKTFDDVTEQKEVVDILKNQLSTNTVRNCYLFVGVSGIGKTSVARILSKEINKGSGGVVELDAASHNSVEDIRDIINRSNYQALDAEYRIFIIDECFVAGSKISTSNGELPIEKVTPGMKVLTLAGESEVDSVHKSIIPNSRICCVKLSNGKNIITTKDHLFMTTVGWIPAKDLLSGDELIEKRGLCDCTSCFELRTGSVCSTEILESSCEYNSNFCELRSSPLLVKEETCDRSGWQYPEVEKPAIERYKERDDVERVWVESVAFYEQGDTGEFRCCGSEYTEMYDLTVRNSPTYFVDGVLVHNCHALSSAAWQSFLKTLEEPNSKTVYMFCTTDPQKIPATILNRVQRFDLKRISYEGIVNRLRYIVSKEIEEGRKLNIDDSVIEYISKLSNGGMRDAVSMLDKCVSFDESISLSDAISVLGAVDYDVMFELFFSIYNYEEKRVIEIVEKIHNDGVDLRLFIKQFTNFLSELCKYKLFENYDYINIPSVYEEKLNRAKNCEDKVLKQMLEKIYSINNKIRYESQALPVVETELLLLAEE